MDGAADFDDESLGFRLAKAPNGVSPNIAPAGTYLLPTGTGAEADVHFRIGHPLAQELIQRAIGRQLPAAEVTFDYAKCGVKLSLVERLRGQSGWLRLTLLSVTALETEDQLVFAGVTDAGDVLDADAAAKLMLVSGAIGPDAKIEPTIQSRLAEQLTGERGRVLDEAMERNQRYFDAQMQKLDLWAEDLKENLESQIKALSNELAAAKREALQATDLATKLELQKKAREIERQRNAKRKSLFESQDAIDAEKDKLLSDTAERLKQQVAESEVFTIRWRVV